MVGIVQKTLGKIEAVAAKARTFGHKCVVRAGLLYGWLSVMIPHHSRVATRLFIKAAGAVFETVGNGALATPRLIKRIREARKFWLFLTEVAGVVLVAFGISLWSVPAAIIIGGLVLVAAVEVRPHVVQTMPDLPIPDDLLRMQASAAAQVINNIRFGVPVVDEKALAKLSRDECERVIQAARAIGAKAAAKA